MNLKNNLKLQKTILSYIVLLYLLVSAASCKIFETICNPCSIKESNGGEPVYICVTHGENGKLPENFEIRIQFDNDVMKKSSKINYSDEISKNYRHNKSLFGNEISVKCSLKASKTAPDIPQGQELFLITTETKKTISKSETNFTVICEGNFESETQNIPLRVERLSAGKSASAKSSVILTKLIPSQGTLTPEFNPGINEYSVNVPYDTKDIEFDTDCENSSQISINRHKLKAAGSTTDVFITVKGEKRGDKNIYHVSVNRDETPDGENSKSKRSILKDFMPHSKSSKRKSKNNKKYDVDEDYDPESNENGSDSYAFKEMAINQKENSQKDKEKLYAIIILSSLLCLYVTYMIIKKKKQLKNKKELNKISKK